MKKLLLSILLLILMSSTSLACTSDVYYLQNITGADDLYTADENEYLTLREDTINWFDWGADWETACVGDPVYRLYNPVSHLHLYTLDANEVRILTSERGWQADNNGQPVFYSCGDYPIYRTYNVITGGHYLTPRLSDYNGTEWPFVKEGIAMYGISSYYPN